jgi:hypothetical protein
MRGQNGSFCHTPDAAMAYALLVFRMFCLIQAKVPASGCALPPVVPAALYQSSRHIINFGLHDPLHAFLKVSTFLAGHTTEVMHRSNSILLDTAGRGWNWDHVMSCRTPSVHAKFQKENQKSTTRHEASHECVAIFGATAGTTMCFKPVHARTTCTPIPLLHR